MSEILNSSELFFPWQLKGRKIRLLEYFNHGWWKFGNMLKENVAFVFRNTFFFPSDRLYDTKRKLLVVVFFIKNSRIFNLIFLFSQFFCYTDE